jgi:N6-adenosine-specific RNA methylase IME4
MELQRRPTSLRRRKTELTAAVGGATVFVHKLCVDPELRTLIPPLTSEECESLRCNLLEQGCRESIVVWKGRNIILDGYHRYEICQRHGIPFDVLEKDFPNRSAAKIWMIDNQLARRNVTQYARSLLALELEPLLAGQARERQALGRKLKRSLNSAGCLSKSHETRDEVAKRAGVSHDTIAKVKLIIQKGTEKEKADLLNPDSNISIHKVYRRIRRNELKANTPPFPKKRFAVIYADPPYQFEFTESECRTVENHYHTMTHEELKNLPVPDIAGETCVLFLWAPACKLLEAASLLNSWGFSYRTHAIWVKNKIGMGHYFRTQHEVLLIGTKGNPPTPAENNRPPSIIRARRRRHSEKPEKVYELIEQMYPSFEKVELFARKTRKGWTSWGNEVP